MRETRAAVSSDDRPNLEQFRVEAHAPRAAAMMNLSLRELVEREVLTSRLPHGSTTQNSALSASADDDLNYDPYFSREAVEFIFLLCRRFKFEAAIRYRTLQYFSAFVAKLRQNEGSCGPSTKAVDPFTSENLLFAVVICLQLASKIESDVDGLVPSQVRKFLGKFRIKLTDTMVINAEMNVLVTLGYRLQRPTQFSILEMTMFTLEAQDVLSSLKCGPEPLYLTALSLLDLTCLYNDEIYDQVCLQIKGSSIKDPENGTARYMYLKHDRLALVGGVLSATVWSLHKNDAETLERLFAFDKCLASGLATPLEEINEFREAIFFVLL